MGDCEVDRQRTECSAAHYRRLLKTYGVDQGENIGVEDLSWDSVPRVTFRSAYAPKVEP
jgi:hypothetical protein